MILDNELQTVTRRQHDKSLCVTDRRMQPLQRQLQQQSHRV